MAAHVREPVKQIDKNSWLIGTKSILRRRSSPLAEYLWKDNNGFWYSLLNATSPLPAAGPLPSASHIRQVNDAEDASAAWSFGDAFLKVKLTPQDFRDTT